MLNKLKRILQLSYQASPQENFFKLRQKLNPSLNKESVSDEDQEINTVIPDIWNQPSFQKLVAYKLHCSKQAVLLLGTLNQIHILEPILTQHGIEVKTLEWDWDAEVNLDDYSKDLQIIYCQIPLNEEQWKATKNLRNRFCDRSIIGIYELVLPFTLLPTAQSSLNYFLKSLDEIIPYYLGESSFGPIDQLNELFPLTGKRVIEFGPFDGCQTAGLVNSGVKSLTCIEARAENSIKVMIARYLFSWNNVELIMDDFHNVDSSKYGTYDLAFAHGVYYHSIAPFLFLENLLSLAENIFLGGFCATDSLPQGDYETIDYEGERYRVKKYKENNYFTAGVNPIGYFFYKKDLINFFEKRNYEVSIISDEESEVTAGNYLRFLAHKKSSV